MKEKTSRQVFCIATMPPWLPGCPRGHHIFTCSSGCSDGKNVVVVTGKLSARACPLFDDHETRHGDKVEWGMAGAEAHLRPSHESAVISRYWRKRDANPLGISLVGKSLLSFVRLCAAQV
jgi:hypothetical protein